MKIQNLVIALMIVSLLALSCSQPPVQEVKVEQPEQEAQPTQAASQVSTSNPIQEVVETPASPQMTDDSTAEAASQSTLKEYEMVSKRFTFDPNVIRVNKGDTVMLHITSTDVAHGIAIPTFGVSERLPSGTRVDIEFIADQIGEFPFFCNVGCGSGHKDMKGMLIVE